MMEIKYDDLEINADDLIPHLEAYAKSVLLKMQKREPEYADCWTACSITFDDLQPEFDWGSIQDIKGSDGFMAVGARHFSPAMRKQIEAVYGSDPHKWPQEKEQGFINTWDQFLTREEAAKVATRLGQCKPTVYFYSEDLY